MGSSLVLLEGPGNEVAPLGRTCSTFQNKTPIVKMTLFNKFLDVLWFLNIYYYELSTASLQSSTVVIHPLKTADWQSKARNNKYLKTRECLKTYYE